MSTSKRYAVILLKENGEGDLHYWGCQADSSLQAEAFAEKEFPNSLVDEAILAPDVLDNSWEESYPALHDMCCTQACGEYLCGVEDETLTIFDPIMAAVYKAGYEDIREVMDVWEPMENEPVERILESIYNSYSGEQRTIQYVMDKVKKGILLTPPGMALERYVGDWDMMEFYEVGLKSENKVDLT